MGRKGGGPGLNPTGEHNASEAMGGGGRGWDEVRTTSRAAFSHIQQIAKKKKKATGEKKAKEKNEKKAKYTENYIQSVYLDFQLESPQKAKTVESGGGKRHRKSGRGAQQDGDGKTKPEMERKSTEGRVTQVAYFCSVAYHWAIVCISYRRKLNH